MARYIDADALDERKFPSHSVVNCYAKGWNDAINAIQKNAPTIEARPVVRGECGWCESGYERCGTCRMFFDYYGDGGSNRCSGDCDDIKCAYYEPIGFCPNCGADMRGAG